MIKKVVVRTNEIKYTVLLTNNIILYTCLTFIEPYQNILEPFARKCTFDYWSNGPIILQYMPICGQAFHPYSKYLKAEDMLGAISEARLFLISTDVDLVVPNSTLCPDSVLIYGYF